MSASSLGSRVTALRDKMPRSLSWQLGTIVAVLGGALVLTSIIAVVAIQQVLAASERRAQAQEQMRVAYQLRGDIQSFTATLLDMAWTRTDRSTELAVQQQSFARNLAEARAQATSAEQQAVLDALAAQREELNQLADQIVALSATNDSARMALLWLEGRDIAARTDDVADRYYRTQRDEAAREQQLAEQRGNTALAFLLASVAISLPSGIAIAWLLGRRIVRALVHLTDAVQKIAAGSFIRVQLQGAETEELVTLANAFDTMSQELEAQRAAQAQWNAELEQKVAERTAELQTSLDEQRKLSEVIREMSTPIIPVLDGVLVMPLIGNLDSGRIVNVQQALLAGVTNHNAHLVIFDLTGVPVVDTQVARALLDSVQMARLLGARCTVVGITPEVAQTMVSLGINLGDLVTLGDLRTAVTQALTEQRVHSRARESQEPVLIPGA